MSLYKINGSKLSLDLHPGQARVWQSPARFTFMLAGTQGGKTSLGPWWLWREIQQCGQGDYLAVTASFDLFKLKMLPELRTVFEWVLKIGKYWAGEKVIELRDPKTGEFWAKGSSDIMWGRIILRSSQSSGGLEAATVKAAWLDECGQDGFTLDDWRAVQRRLALAEGKVLGTTTLYNLGWILTEVYELWKEGDTDYDVVQFASILNPLFPIQEFERARRTMQAWRFSMFYLGLFAKPIGLIYSCFTDDMLCDPIDIPKNWPRVVGVDFGGANTSTLWLAEDPETKIWYVYRETLQGGKSSQEHVDVARDSIHGTNCVFIGGAQSEDQHRMDWGAAGLDVLEPSIWALEPGIDRVISLMRSGLFRVFRTCRGLRDELGGYRRKLDDDSKEVTDEIIKKRNYHRLDALRYAATFINVGDEVLLGWGG